MRKLLTIALILAANQVIGQAVPDPSYWDRKQYFANWIFDYQSVVRVNELRIEDKTAIDSTGALYRYMATAGTDGKLLIGNSATGKWGLGNITSTDGSVNVDNAESTIDLSVEVGGADLTGLTEDQVLFGASDGSIGQSEYVLFDDGMYAGYGAGIRIRNESSPMVLPSWAMLRLEALEGNAEIHLQAGAIAKSGIRFFNWTGNTQWYVHMDESENFLIQNLAEDDDFRVNAATLRFTENELGEHTFFMNGSGFKIQNNDNPAVLKFDQDGTVYTIANDGTSLEIDADAVDITGDLTAANLAAGTYTPTAANVSNCATFGTVYGHYMSYGNMVWINIKVDINATSSSTLTTASFTLPAGLTSDFTASQDVIGNMTWITTINGSGGAGRVYADPTSDLIYVEYRPSNTTTFKVNITASYVIQ